MKTDQPNILWIQTDEQRTDSLGCYGSGWARTPNLDALAARGVVFRNGYCQSPLCVPSRSSQLACVYPQECNTMLNTKEPFPSGTMTFPEVFAQAGYRTVNYGKWHTPPHPVWQESEDIRHFRQYSTIRELAEGYDYAEHGVVRDPKTSLILAGRYPGGMDNPSRAVTDLGIEFLRRYDGSRPFLRVSHLWPHTPVLPPAPFDMLYKPDNIPIRCFDEAAFHERSLRARTWGDHFGLRELDHDQFCRIWTAYMGLCAYIDHETGRLLDALREEGLAENTIVVFSADHGRALGEYGAAEKHTFDDAVWRVPFIMAWPGHLPEGETREDLCGLIDTGRTLAGLALAGEALPNRWRGRDLFHDPVPDADTQAVFGQIGFPDGSLEAARKQRQRRPRAARVIPDNMRIAIRTRRYRMDIDWMAQGKRVPQSDQDGQLFDMETDPQERRNLFENPGCRSVRYDLTDRLTTWFATLQRPASLFG